LNPLIVTCVMAQRSALMNAGVVLLILGLLYLRLAAIYAPLPVQPRPDPVAASHREDADLFERTLAMGLLRPGADGRIAVAPADLPLRQIFRREHPELLTPRHEEPDWLHGRWDDASRRWHRALHFSAAGRYVRQQIEQFNARTAAVLGQAQWVGAGLREIERNE
jgi:hypothetical protein